MLKAGYEVLYLTVDEDEIVLQMLENAYDKPFVSVASEDALPVTDAEKASVEQAEKDHKALLDFAQEMETEHTDVMTEIESTGNLSGPAIEVIRSALEDAKKRVSATWQA